MSHAPLRKGQDCLNCGTIVQGRFCHVCGQENVVPKETFWHMVTHFFYDITHFDSNFFHTVHHLILRPGFLSREYMLGRRAKYLHPVRMYVFTSAIFFLFFFSLFKPESPVGGNINQPLNTKQRAEYIAGLRERMEQSPNDKNLKASLALLQDTSKPVTPKDILHTETRGIQIAFFTDNHYKSVEEYNAVQKSLPASKKDGWFKRRLMKKDIEINRRFKENPDEAGKEFSESILHRLPYMLFISLPLFALILKLVYIRRKQFYFADHGVLTIHLYIFTFLLLLVVFGLNKLEEYTAWQFLNIATIILFILLSFYQLKAMKNFYGQGWGKTFFKFLIVALSSLIMMITLFVLFMFFSAITF